jgi:hypothetical protein
MKANSIKDQQALRYNDGKLRWGLVDWDALAPMVRVLEYGCKKYADHNWKKGLPYTATSESLLRHLYAFLGGEDIDPESGLLHVGHILCNAMFLSYMSEYKKEFDDRYIDKNKFEEDVDKAFEESYGTI